MSSEITTQDILALRTEAGQAGDSAMVETCWDALYHEDDEIRRAAWDRASEAIVEGRNRT